MRVAGSAVIMAIIVALVSCATTDEDATPVNALEGYETWMKVNSKIISGDATGTLGRNVHQGSAGFRDVFVNRTGEAVASGQADTPFPVGSILVKNSYGENDGAMGDLADITVMVKREAGYDAENGDWEYIMLSDAMKVRGQGTINSCIQCHSAAAGNDYTFLSYR